MNTGNVPLKVIKYFTSDGVKDDETSLWIVNPGERYDMGGGWWRIGDGITPGTETEDLLGTVTIHYYYKGFDPDNQRKMVWAFMW